MGYFNTKMPSEEVLQIGKPLVIDVSDPELAGLYKSSIFDMDVQKRIIKIGMPSFKGTYVPLPSGTRLYVKMIDKSSMYVFQSRILSYKKDEEGFYVSFISMPDTVRRIQRRQFLRVPFFKEGTFLRVTDNETYPFISKDLSAGGLLIVTKPRLSLNEMIRIDFNINDSIIVSDQLARIVRVQNHVTSKNQILGVKFEGFPRLQEDSLVRFVFKLEQERKRKAKEEGGND